MPCGPPPPTWCFGFLLGNKGPLRREPSGREPPAAQRDCPDPAAESAGLGGGGGPTTRRSPPTPGRSAPGRAQSLRVPHPLGFQESQAKVSLDSWQTISSVFLEAAVQEGGAGGGGVEGGQGREGHEGKGKKQEGGGLKPD